MVANPADAAAGFSHRSRSFQQRIGAIARRRRSRSRNKDEDEGEGKQHAPPRSKSGSAIPYAPPPSNTMNTGTAPNSGPSRHSMSRPQQHQQQQQEHPFSHSAGFSSESSLSADEMLVVTGIDIRTDSSPAKPNVMKMQPGPSSYLISSSDDDEEKLVPVKRKSGRGGMALLRKTFSGDGLKRIRRGRSDGDGGSDDGAKIVDTAAAIPPIMASSSTDVNSNKDGSASSGVNPENMDDLYEHDIDEAIKELKFLEETSRLPRDREIPKIRWNDITLEEVLGYGGFSQVNRALVRSPLLQGKDTNASTNNNNNSKKKSTTTSTSEAEGRRYALKCLDDRLLQSKNRKKVIEAALDVAVEGDILARLSHPNIIRLHGVSTTNLVTVRFTHKGMRDYFLLLDLLQETLLDRLQVWRRKIFLKSLVKRPLSKKKMLERIEVAAVGVARGMAYLHEKKVVLRDLKPENVGFDCNGTPKLFDFGFAREAHNVRSDEIAGSHCYMAPEMALGLGSDITADVYSFGVVLWELSSLQKPTEQFKMKKGFRRNRLNYSFRPSVTNIPSRALRKLIQECWSFRSSDRPEFRHILQVLEMVIPMEVYDRAVSHDSISSETDELYSSAHFPDKVSNKEWGLDKISPSNAGLDLASRTVTSVPLDDSSIRKERLMSGSNHSRLPMNGSNHSRKLMNSSNHSRKLMGSSNHSRNQVKKEKAEEPTAASLPAKKLDVTHRNKKQVTNSPLPPVPPSPPSTSPDLMTTPRKDNKSQTYENEDEVQKHNSARNRRSETVPALASPRTPKIRGANKKPKRTDSSTMDLKSPISVGSPKLEVPDPISKPTADLSPTTGITQKKKDATTDEIKEDPKIAGWISTFPAESFVSDSQNPEDKSSPTTSADRKKATKEEAKKVDIPAQIEVVSEKIGSHNEEFSNSAWKSPLPAEKKSRGLFDKSETNEQSEKQKEDNIDVGATKQPDSIPTQIEVLPSHGADSSAPSNLIENDSSKNVRTSTTRATGIPKIDGKEDKGDIPTQIEVVPSTAIRERRQPLAGAAAVRDVDNDEPKASVRPRRESLREERGPASPTRKSVSYLGTGLKQESPPRRSRPLDRSSLQDISSEETGDTAVAKSTMTVDDLERKLDETTDEMVTLQAEKNALVARIASKGSKAGYMESELKCIESKLSRNALKLIEIETQLEELGS